MPQQREGIAAAVRRARQTVALRQNEFAHRLGELRGEKPHQPATIGSWERGDSIPDALDLLNAARLAGVPVSLLIGGDSFGERFARLERKVESMSRCLQQQGLTKRGH